ncbi:MAG: hypothetical protein ACKVS6_02575 [Planctomycetota bacterium]
MQTRIYQKLGERGESAIALAALLLASVLVIFAIILLVAKLTAPGKSPSARPSVAAREDSIEKVYIGRSGDLGFVLRGPGPALVGKFRSQTESRVLALGPGEMIARIDAYNFSNESVKLVDGEWNITIGSTQMRPLPSKGNTDPPSPLHAALAGGSLDTDLAPFTSRRVGFVGIIDAFDQGDSASFRRGKIAEDVILRATRVSERELAEFDRAPAMTILERLSGEKTPGTPLR